LSTVGGGDSNNADGQLSTVGGGSFNGASGLRSTVPGGESNFAEGDFSLAAGRRAHAKDTGAFVWADATDENFASTGENQFLIRASGGVGIGTNSPGAEMEVFDNQSDHTAIRIKEGQTIPAVWELRAHQNPRSLNNGFSIWGGGEGEEDTRLAITHDGDVGIGTDRPDEKLTVNGNVRADQFLTASSERWKTNIQTIEGALEKVESLRGVSYNWRADGKHDIGLIAEEVGEVIPEVVVYEENGRDATAVDYAGLVPVLIQAVKEQQELLEEKDAHIAALKQEKDTEIAALQARMTALEESVGAGAKSAQIGGLLPFGTSVVWMITGGLGLLLVAPGLMLGYRRTRRDQ
jgi:hypothetical protein